MDLLDDDADHIGDEIIVYLVEKCPNLYNSQCKDYKNRAMRENAWTSIAEAMNSNVPEVMKQWERLKRKWLRERKMMHTPPASGSACTDRPLWPMYKIMSFLEPFVATRATHTNTSTSSTPAIAISQLKGHGFVKKRGGFSTRYTPSPSAPRQWDATHVDDFPESHISSPETHSSSLQCGSSSSIQSLCSPLQNFSTRSSSPSHNFPSRSSSPALATILNRSSSPSVTNPLIVPYEASMSCQPDKFHTVKKRKNEELSDVLKTSFQQLGTFMEKRTTAPVESGDETIFGQDVGRMVGKVKGNKRRAQCKRRLMEVLEEYLSDSD